MDGMTDEVIIKMGVEQGLIYYARIDSIANGEPHYYVVLDSDPKLRTSLLLACATSQSTPYRLVEDRGLPLDTLVVVQIGQYHHFDQKTIFNCNDLIERPTDELIRLKSESKLRVLDTLPPNLIKDLIDAVGKSPVVIQSMKDRIIKTKHSGTEGV